MSSELYGEQSYIEHFRAGGAQHVVDGVLLNAVSRKRKAKKILAVLSDFLARPLDELDCLDIGCSGGHITRELGTRFRRTVGLDTDAQALDIARSLDNTPGLVFEQGSATAMAFADECFDVVVCNHVYEHVNDQRGLLREIRRVLRPGGLCYFGAGNRFAPIEPHYRLPALAWPPKPIANLYLRLAGKQGPYGENHLSYWGLRRLVDGFRLHDYTLRILREPSRFSGGDSAYNRLPTRMLPETILRLARPVFPTYVWLLEKR
jgi:SAM-dependent methyltransferase